jgi:hypothetical protein
MQQVAREARSEIVEEDRVEFDYEDWLLIFSFGKAADDSTAFSSFIEFPEKEEVIFLEFGGHLLFEELAPEENYLSVEEYLERRDLARRTLENAEAGESRDLA